MATVSALRAPNVDVPRMDLPAFEVPDIDVEGAVSQAAEAVGLREPARRSRWLLAIGALIVVAAAGWGLLRNPQVRVRSQQVLESIRLRISTMRPNAFDLDVGGRADPIAFPATETKPIPPDRAADVATPAGG
jgi:hypothetical protein